MCHAQYDGLSLGTIFSTFAAFYCGQKPPAPPSFAGYIKHALQYRDVGLHYWRTLLNGSQVTKLKPCTEVAGMCQTDCRLNQSIRFKETVTPPQNYREYTPATIFTALCARMLAGITQSSDVVFGLVVSGRASLPHELLDVIGPCLNVVPIRLHLQEGDQFLSVLSSIHDQRLNGLAYETSQFNDIAEHCTDWPNDTKDFGLVIQFQNIDENPTTEIAGMSSTLCVYHRHHEAPASDCVGIMAKPVGNTWELEIAANSRFHSEHTIADVLKELSVQITSN